MTIQKLAKKFGVSASTAFEKVNTVGTDENLFRLVSVPGHGARVLPLELVPVPGHGARVLPLELVPVPRHGARVLPLELVPVPGHGARVLPLELVPVPRHGDQISTQEATKGYVQTGAREPEQGLKEQVKSRWESFPRKLRA